MSNSTSSSSITTHLGSTSTTVLSSSDESSTTTSQSSSSKESSSGGKTSLVKPTISSLSSDSSNSSDFSSSSILVEGSSSSNSTSESSDSTKSFHNHSSSSSISSSSVSLSSSESSFASSSSSIEEQSSSSAFHTHASPSSSSLSPSSSTLEIVVSSSIHSSSESSTSSFSSSQVSSSAAYGEASSDTPTSTTFVYTQMFCLTGSDTTITTALPVSTVLEDPSTFSYSSGSTVTTDLATYANSLKLSTSDSSSSDSATKGKIAGSVVGSVAGVSLILFLLWFFVFRKRSYGGLDNSEKNSFTHSISSTRRLENHDYDDYGGTDTYRDYNEKRPTGHSSPYAFGFLSRFKKSSSSLPDDTISERRSPPPPPPPRSPQQQQVPTSYTPQPDLNGLGSLRSSILNGQDFQEIPNERTPINASSSISNNSISVSRPHRSHPQDTQLRTIDTVYEETESESSTLARSHRNSTSLRNGANSQRFQNAGLTPYMAENPFDETQILKRPPPPPPPVRKALIDNTCNTAGASLLGSGNVNRYSIESNTSSFVSESDGSSTDESFGSIQMDGTAGADSGGFFREMV